MDTQFDSTVDRTESLSVKWNKTVIQTIAGNPEAQPFWVADMDFSVADRIREKAVELAGHGVYGYPYEGNKREAFCSWVKQRHAWDVNVHQVVVCQGVLSSIAVLTEMLSEPSDAVILPLPAYQPFVKIINNFGRKLLSWPLAYDQGSHRFSLDWEAFELLCTQAKILLFCSPHNPSGLVFSETDLTKLCSIASAHGVTIISDEIHADLNFKTHHPLVPIAERTGCQAITCMAPSKTFNVAGEHYSVAVFHDIQLKKNFVKRLEQLFISEPSLFSTTVAMAAYQSGGPWLSALLAYLQGNINYIDDYLKQHIPSLALVKPEASFIAFLDCSKIMDLVEQDATNNPALYDSRKSPAGGLLSRFFGQRASVAVNDGTWFGGEAYRQFVRFNFGTSRTSIEKALNRMKNAVNLLFETYSK